MPPLHRRANDLWHRAGRGDCESRLPAFPERLNPGLDGLGFVRKPVFQITLLRLIGARQRQRRGVADMQVVIDGPHGNELDRRVRQPVEYVALPIFRSDTVEVVDARVPGEPLHGEAVGEAAERLVLVQ